MNFASRLSTFVIVTALAVVFALLLVPAFTARAQDVIAVPTDEVAEPTPLAVADETVTPAPVIVVIAPTEPETPVPVENGDSYAWVVAGAVVSVLGVIAVVARFLNTQFIALRKADAEKFHAVANLVPPSVVDGYERILKELITAGELVTAATDFTPTTIDDAVWEKVQGAADLLGGDLDALVKIIREGQTPVAPASDSLIPTPSANG